jgi:hypothetical protein
MITYAEITIHKELKPETMADYFTRLINETKRKTKDTIIILFDDMTIVDAKNYTQCVDMERNGFNTLYPIYFDIEKKTFFAGYHTETNLFSDKSNLKDSPYNCIYYTSLGEDVFAISRIKSSDESPRFVVAYKDTFEKKHVIHLVHSILSN